MKRLLLFAVVILAAMQVSAQLQVLKNGKPRASIAIVEESEVNQDAAMLLNKFIERMSGVRLPISLSKDKNNLIKENFEDRNKYIKDECMGVPCSY